MDECTQESARRECVVGSHTHEGRREISLSQVDPILRHAGLDGELLRNLGTAPDTDRFPIPAVKRAMIEVHHTRYPPLWTEPIHVAEILEVVSPDRQENPIGDFPFLRQEIIKPLVLEAREIAILEFRPELERFRPSLEKPVGVGDVVETAFESEPSDRFDGTRTRTEPELSTVLDHVFPAEITDLRFEILANHQMLPG